MTPEQKKRRVEELLEDLDDGIRLAISGHKPTAAHFRIVENAKTELERLDPEALKQWYEEQNSGLSKHLDKALLISALGAFGTLFFGLVKLLKDSNKS
jgi:hypothetical protein